MGKRIENYKITTGYKLKFRANYIIQVEEKEWINGNWDRIRTKQHENLSNNSTNGQLSKKSTQKLKSSINWLVTASQHKNLKSLKTQQQYKFKINFITLTIPPQEQEQVEEKKFKTIINTFLTYHRKYSKLNNYVWKIEKHKDNRLHIHILTDTFIHHNSIRNSWNIILLRNGLLEYHNKKFNNYNPNSTDIHSIRKVKKVAAYMVKYMAKNNQKDMLYNGRVWSCSSKISSVMQNCLIVSPDKIGEVMRPLFNKKIEYKSIMSEPNQFNNSFHVADLYMLKPSDWNLIKGSIVYELFKELITSLRSGKQISMDFNFNLN